MIEHDALKGENQELSNQVFGYREEEIRLRGEQEQNVMEMQQEHKLDVNLRKEELMEREQKIIFLDKERFELE